MKQKKPSKPLSPLLAVKLEAMRSGKLVDLRPQRYRRWSTERLLSRLKEIEAMENVPLPIAEVMDLVAESDEIEDELRRR